MNIKIREYRDTDYAACRALFGELVQHYAEIYEDPSIAGDDPGRGFDIFLARNDRCCSWVAESDAEIVGFGGLLDTVAEEDVAEIEPLIVSSGFRSQGIGSKLVHHIAGEAKKKGFRFLTIKPDVRNKKAFDLYVRLGFDMVGQVELFQNLSRKSKRTWKSGIEIHGHQLKY
jgi:ribosomal protein S18 acetylase RimI-like enzyme